MTAEEHYKMAHEIYEKHARWYYGGITEEMATEILNEAKLEFTKVIELDPMHFDAFFYRGIVSKRIEDKKGESANYADILSDFTKSIQLKPSSRAFFHRAKTKLELNDEEGSRKDFLAALNLDPDSDARAYV